MAKLRVVLWNTNGLLSRRQELEQFLVQQKIDIALVTETHCTPTYMLTQLRSYSAYHTVHPSVKAQGGAAVFMRKSITHTLYFSNATDKIHACSIKIQSKPDTVILAAPYCTPSRKIDAVDFDLVFQNFGSRWLVGGDHNAKHTHWGAQCITPRGCEFAKVSEK